MKSFLKTHEAADFLGVSKWTVKKWRSTGKGPPYIKGGKTDHPLYRRSDLQNYLDANTVNPTSGE